MKLLEQPAVSVQQASSTIVAAIADEFRDGVPAPSTRVKLSVVIPVYNEERWLRELIRRVQQTSMDKELIVVDDCSTDGSRAILRELASEHANIQVVLQPCNRGKGAALREGFRHVRGDVVLVQDADLEYDPADYSRLLQPILDGRADVVYGSRFLDGRRGTSFWHYLANRLVTQLSNLFTRLSLTDMETGYKLFRRQVLQEVTLVSDRFGFEPEITAKIARRRSGPPWRICEVPIRYQGRSYREGKKIRLSDAFQTLWCIVRFQGRG
jgi:glycosyltransferase involved in cell wall biosynthesis